MTRRGGAASEMLPMFEIVDDAQPQPADVRARPRRRNESQRDAPRVDNDLVGQTLRPEVGERRGSRQVHQRQLPPTLDVVTAGTLLGVGRTVAYRLVRQGRWPTHVVRVGRKIVIPTFPLLEFLGIHACDVPDVVAVSTGSRNGLDPLVAEGTALPRPPRGR